MMDMTVVMSIILMSHREEQHQKKKKEKKRAHRWSMQVGIRMEGKYIYS